MRILVADDDATSRLIIRMALRNLGHECHVVADGDTALRSFQFYRPDVVISDWMMPGLSGIELCRRIRSDTRTPYAYFILVSGQRALADVLAGMNAGADDYLVKPIDPDDLRARLIAAARLTDLHRQLAVQQKTLEGMNDELASLARRDPLTGLANRRALGEDLENLEARVVRYGHQYCIALVDVDHFKSYNDTYGHQGGDDVLAKVATQLSQECRSGDVLYRYGGDEMLCILSEQSLDSSAIAVERMRSAVERLAIAHQTSPSGVVTVSAGLAMLDRAQLTTVAEVLTQADRSLYEAKRLGRNRVAWASVGDEAWLANAPAAT